MNTGPGWYAAGRRAARAAAVAVACFPLLTCGSQPPAAQDRPVAEPAPALVPPTPPSSAAREQIVEIAIREYTFQPAEIRIPVGTTVRWTNHEKRASHSVLFTGEGGFESERMFPGESWERRFDKPGVYPFTCGPHPEMHGRIEVTD